MRASRAALSPTLSDSVCGLTSAPSIDFLGENKLYIRVYGVNLCGTSAPVLMSRESRRLLY